MGPIRNIFENGDFPLSTQEYSRSNNGVNNQRSINDIPTENNEEDVDHDDCFVKFGFVSSSEEKNQRLNKRNSKQKTQENENEQDQPAYLVEEIDAITALMIYDTYSKKHEFTFSAQHRVS